MKNNEEKKTKSGFIALLGRPNVGKSSLMNALLEQKIAIVSPRVQTTRTKILGVYNYPNNEAQAIFLDLPGMHKPIDKLSESCRKITLDGAKEADLIIFMSEANCPPGKGDTWISKWLMENCSGTSLLIVLNKKDLVRTHSLETKYTNQYLDLFKGFTQEPKVITTSCFDEKSLKELLDRILLILPEGPFYFPDDIPTNRSLRFLACELIREQVLLLTNEEVPHSCAVEIVEFQENEEKQLTTIRANILVETESQKSILVGKKGSKIKEIGSNSRKEIEELLNSKVFLELKVKQSKTWRNNPRKLKELNPID
ncbi:MAG: GTPase Era [Candidatus Caenarcaniphilales bacterium]|nr:GTPase Era [Candidatus Caenarcaniphilales bacterium]